MLSIWRFRVTNNAEGKERKRKEVKKKRPEKDKHVDASSVGISDVAFQHLSLSNEITNHKLIPLVHHLVSSSHSRSPVAHLLDSGWE